MTSRYILLSLLVSCPGLFSQEADRPLRVGSGVTAPKLLHKVEPEFTPAARLDQVQGTVLYTLVVDKNGRARDIEVVSPIGWGLDEAGREAIQKWTFTPGQKDGLPVNILAQVEVNFRLLDRWFDSRLESRRTNYNLALHDMGNPAKNDKAVASLEKLASEKFPPAMALVGRWKMEGKVLPKDFEGGLGLVQKAADKYNGNGLYFLANLYLSGSGVPADPEKGLKMMRDASMYGSSLAQIYLGQKYESGEGLAAPNPARAADYFRLCATRGVATCQFHLGKHLMPRQENGGNAIQALAWLELARDANVAEAEPLLASLQGTLSAGDVKIAEKLKSQLVRK